MEVPDGLVLALAFLGMACLPIIVAMVLCADELIDRVVCRFVDWREERRERRKLGRLDRAVAADPSTGDHDLTEFDRTDRLSIEQIAADLRNLGGHRVGLRSRAVLWDPNVLQAYDERLRQASRCLGITEHLADLEGVDREIERIRVEGELHAAGLALPAAQGLRGQRQR